VTRLVWFCVHHWSELSIGDTPIQFHGSQNSERPSHSRLFLHHNRSEDQQINFV
jgi:hypothetical protein